MNREQKARDLMAAILREVFRPEATTTGACSTEGCRKRARGSGTCADCLAHELDELIDSSVGTNYVYACRALRRSERGVLDAAGGDD